MQSRVSVFPEKNIAGLSALNGLMQYFHNLPPAYSLLDSVQDIRQGVISGSISCLDIHQFDHAIEESIKKASSFTKESSSFASNNSNNVRSTHSLTAAVPADLSIEDSSLFTKEHIAAIALYTYPFFDPNQSFFGVLNRILRTGHRGEVRPFLKYIWLLLHALMYCPDSNKNEGPITVCRGIDVDAREDYIVGSEVIWRGFSSSSTDFNIQKSFCAAGAASINTVFIINLTTQRARNISKYSLLEGESEVLLPPNSCFRVTMVTDTPIADKTIVITLQEIPSSDPILHYGVTCSAEILDLIRSASALSSFEETVAFMSNSDNCENVLVFQAIVERALGWLVHEQQSGSLYSVLGTADQGHQFWQLFMHNLRKHALLFIVPNTAVVPTAPSFPLETREDNLDLNLASECVDIKDEKSLDEKVEPVLQAPENMNMAAVLDLGVLVSESVICADIPPISESQQRSAVSIAEVGLSLLRKMSRRGDSEELADQQPAVITQIGRSGGVGLTLDILRDLGPGNARLAVQGLAFLHFVVSQNDANRELVGRLGGCEVIITMLSEHGTSNSYIANHGLWCLHYLKTSPENLYRLELSHHSDISNLIVSTFEEEYLRGEPLTEESVLLKMKSGQNLLQFYVWQHLSNPVILDFHYRKYKLNTLYKQPHSLQAAEHANRQKHRLVLLAEYGVPLAQALVAVATLSSPRAHVPLQWMCRHYSRLCWSWLQRSVGTTVADYCRARLLQTGVEGVIEQDIPTAVALLHSCVQRRYALAQISLAICYETGEGVPQDSAKAVRLYRLAAEQGGVGAQSNLAGHLASGVGVPKDESESVYWYQRAAEQTYPLAMYKLATKYEAGEGVEKDVRAAMRLYRQAAQLGECHAQLRLAMRLAAGAGIPEVVPDPEESLYWYIQSAQQGLAAAQYGLASHYAKVKTPEEAIRWYREAVAQNHERAQFRLALLLAQGDRSVEERLQEYIRNAETGDAQCQFELGFRFATGDGVPQDYELAAFWYRKAAEKGHCNAQYGLGKRYAAGQGVATDLDEARRWFTLAAAQGHVKAQAALNGTVE